jgi:hypothetical protein
MYMSFVEICHELWPTSYLLLRSFWLGRSICNLGSAVNFLNAIVERLTFQSLVIVRRQRWGCSVNTSKEEIATQGCLIKKMCRMEWTVCVGGDALNDHEMRGLIGAAPLNPQTKWWQLLNVNSANEVQVKRIQPARSIVCSLVRGTGLEVDTRMNVNHS